jgi:hypothetical protein
MMRILRPSVERPASTADPNVSAPRAPMRTGFEHCSGGYKRVGVLAVTAIGIDQGPRPGVTAIIHSPSQLRALKIDERGGGRGGCLHGRLRTGFRQALPPTGSGPMFHSEAIVSASRNPLRSKSWRIISPMDRRTCDSNATNRNQAEHDARRSKQ